MRKYRSNDSNDDNGDTITTAGTAPPPTRLAFLQYLDDYEDAVADADTSYTEQTIDEEFSSYTNSIPRRSAALDPIKFWEVSFAIYNCLMNLRNVLLS
jgi:hypothetical protein